VYLVDGLDGIQVVNAGIEANLVQDSDACILGFLVELPESRRNVACSDDWLLVLDGCFDDCRMKDVWDEGNDKINFVNSSAQSFVVPGVKFDSSGICKRLGQ
jgi:hypothetical protein